MKEYKVTYETEEEDICKVIVEALNISNAKEVATREYWDIDNIHIIEEVG